MAATHKKREQALQRLEAAGERVTDARIDILATLLAAERALSHRELETAVKVGGRKPDRVTLYRVLDWLVEHGLAHKVASEDRVWRFNALAHERKDHAHFHCERCGRVFCLDDDTAATKAPHLPRGFRPRHVELTVQGTCAQCG
jgi:Fur family transcriptional regulator, ferric uptake regulator